MIKRLKFNKFSNLININLQHKSITYMKRIFFTLIAFVALLTSCKNDKTEEVKANDEESATGMKVTVEAIVPKDDIFQFFYSEDGSDNYPGDKVVTANVKGDGKVQAIFFNFPEDAFPKALRFDMGGNKEQKNVEFKNVKIEYYNKSIVIKDTLFRYYFYPNEQIKYDIKTAIATPNIIEGEPYDPIFMPTNDFKKELKTLLEGPSK